MGEIGALAMENLGSPMVLSFVLGLAAALARSDLTFPEAAAKAMSLYLLFAIGFKGGAAVADHGADARLFAALAAGAVLSAALPLVAFLLLRVASGLSRVDAAAVAAHIGSISIVTFVAGTALLTGRGIEAEGYLVAVAAVMETPAILVALWLARSGRSAAPEPGLWREIALNGSIVVLTGSFVIGAITGAEGLAEISPFITDPFKGVLCLFLLDMGLVAGRGLRGSAGRLGVAEVGFGLVMPLIGAGFGLATGVLLGLSTGGVTLLAVLSASASYIAVPAAMRVALPEANPGVSLGLSLGVTFPFNLTLGLPLYLAAAEALS